MKKKIRKGKENFEEELLELSQKYGVNLGNLIPQRITIWADVNEPIRINIEGVVVSKKDWKRKARY
jgi:hypothetical protein